MFHVKHHPSQLSSAAMFHVKHRRTETRLSSAWSTTP